MGQELTPRERLAQLLEDRRLDLDMDWTEIAEGAGISTETLRQIRFGSGGSARTFRNIEKVVGWARGSIANTLDGGEPVIDESGPAVLRLRTVSPRQLPPDPRPVGLGLDALATDLPEDVVEPVRALLRAARERSGLSS